MRQQNTLFKGNNTARHIKLTVTDAYDLFIGVYRIEVRGSMGPNSPQKFSAAKLFGFGGAGDSKKVPDPPPAPVQEQPSAFANSFSTQAIKMDNNKFESFKGFGQQSPQPQRADMMGGGKQRSFDEEPVMTAGNWRSDVDDVNDDGDMFNDSDDADPFPEEIDNKKTEVVGFTDAF